MLPESFPIFSTHQALCYVFEAGSFSGIYERRFDAKKTPEGIRLVTDNLLLGFYGMLTFICYSMSNPFL